MSNAAPALVQSELVLGRYRPAAAARERRLRLGLARPGRAERPRRRPQDRPPGGEGGLPGRARGRGRRAAAPPCAASARTGSGATRSTSTSPTSTSRAAPSARRCAAASSTTTSAIEASAQVLEALAHAHARGIVHRDVKPSNVLLAEGEGVSVRVLDFGLAQIQEAETLTAQGDVPGTLAYIAPERLAGAADDRGGGHLGGRRDALGGARRPPSVLARARCSRRRARSRPARRRSRRCGPTCRSRCSPPSTARSTSIRPGGRAQRRSPATLRLAGRKRRGPQGAGSDRSPFRRSLPRLVPAALAGRVAGWTAWALPFFPAGWPLGLAALAGGRRVVRPRSGSRSRSPCRSCRSGTSRSARRSSTPRSRSGCSRSCGASREHGLLFSLGPLLAPIAALGAAPAGARSRSASPVRRRRPGGGGRPRGGRRRRHPRRAAARSTAPRTAGPRDRGERRSVRRSLRLSGAPCVARPALAVETLVLAAVAVLLPLARARGPWAVAVLGAAFLAAALLAGPGGRRRAARRGRLGHLCWR